MQGSDDSGPAPEVEISEPKTVATGIPAVVSSITRTVRRMGPLDPVRTLLRLNQPDGFDCPGCAWPEPPPGDRSRAEFCESGAKAVAEEATHARADRSFFAGHSVDDLRARSDHWLGEAGRLTEPMLKAPGGTHFEPIGWSGALDLIVEHLHRLSSPDEAIFYTSGRTSNEAAFLYQLLARCFGTNNLPDCSNMCHEPTSVALKDSLGIGKGSVRLSDLYEADVIIVAGQNPGTNHPRMLTALERAKRNGARIIAVNPLPEAGLLRFRNPQTVRGLAGPGTRLADLHLPIRLGTDQALFQLWNHWRVRDAEDARTPLDDAFIADHTAGFPTYRAHALSVDPHALLAATGLDPGLVTEAYEMVRDAGRVIVCWAMGITQHRNATETIAEIVNLALLGGHIGRTGAGLCPVRGHSNVQGDRTMGIWEKAVPQFLDALEAEFGVTLPREDGHDTVSSVRAIDEGRASVFIGLGGNFLRAVPDTDRTERAFRRVALMANISTKLNRSHLVPEGASLILPTLGRTDRDGDHLVTVEDSMGMVHASRGTLDPPSPATRSEVAIVAGLGERLLGREHPVPWARLACDYAAVRDHIERTIDGFERFNERVREPGGFELPHPPRDRRAFPTSDGRAHFVVTAYAPQDLGTGHHLVLQTLRSHDQYNTTIYGHDDRYRGIKGDRHVLMVNPADIERLGFRDGDVIDIVTALDGPERRAAGYRLVAYPTPVGSAAAYYPETNVLIPLDHHGPDARTPASKFVPIRIEARQGAPRPQPTRSSNPFPRSDNP